MKLSGLVYLWMGHDCSKAVATVTSAIGSGKVCRPRSMSDPSFLMQLLSLHAWTSAACGAALAVILLLSGR